MKRRRKLTLPSRHLPPHTPKPTQMIICSGVSIGDRASMLGYLSMMSGEMSKPSFKECERNGVDQGVHNVLVHTGRLEDGGVRVKVHRQGGGTVANLQAGVAKYRAKVGVVNGEGGRVDVVHQYDRDGELQDNLFREFVGWNMAVDREGAGQCQGYMIKEVRREGAWGKKRQQRTGADSPPPCKTPEHRGVQGHMRPQPRARL